MPERGPHTAPEEIILWCGDEPDSLTEMTAEDWNEDVSWALAGSGLDGVAYVRADVVEAKIAELQGIILKVCGENGVTFHADNSGPRFMAQQAAEMMRARAKFPEPAGRLAALTEEVGELSKALLEEEWTCVVAEAVQVAVVAQRIAEEGDPTLNGIRKANGLEVKA